MTNQRFFKCICAATCVGIVAPVLADESNDGVATLSSIVVQGHEIHETVGTTSTDRTVLDRRAIQNWEDFAKRGDPTVNFSNQTNSVNIRGVDGDRVVTTVDGIKVPWLNDGARGVTGGASTIEFSSLSSIDLVRGAGATQSGSITGYLGLHTLNPSDIIAPDSNFGALIKGGYDSADNSWQSQAALASRFDNGTSWLLQAGVRRGHELDNMGTVGGYGASRSKPDPESYTKNNFLLKLQHQWQDAHSLTLTGEQFHFWSNTDAKFDQGPGTSFALDAQEHSQDLKRQRISLGYSYLSPRKNSLLDTGDFKLYWQSMRLEEAQDGQRTTSPIGPYGRSNIVKNKGYGAITNWSGYINTAVQQHWSLGGDIGFSKSKQGSSGYDSCVKPYFPFSACNFLHTNQADTPEVKAIDWSLWAENEFSWDDGKYALTPALRFDYSKLKPQSGGNYANNPNTNITTKGDKTYSHFSPSLTASYKPLEKLELYAKYGYGFKAPNANQLYLNFGGPGTYLRTGNENLEAEISQGWEIGAKAGDADLGGYIAIFNNRYKNYIDIADLNPSSADWRPEWNGQYPLGVTSYINRNRVRIYGLELGANWAINSNWYTKGALAWSQGKDLDADTYINSIAPLRANLALGYKTKQWGVEGMLNMAAARNKTASPEDYTTPGYGVLDLNSWWQPSSVKGLNVQAGIYNVFDKKYWNALDLPLAGERNPAHPFDYYSEPGRNFRVSLTYQY